MDGHCVTENEQKNRMEMSLSKNSGRKGFPVFSHHSSDDYFRRHPPAFVLYAKCLPSNNILLRHYGRRNNSASIWLWNGNFGNDLGKVVGRNTKLLYIRCDALHLLKVVGER